MKRRPFLVKLFRAAYILSFGLIPVIGKAQDGGTPNQVSFTTRAVMPLPSQLEVTGGPSFPLTTAFLVETAGADSPRLKQALARMLFRLSNQTGLRLSKPSISAPSLVVRVAAAASAVQSLEADESYALTVTAGGIRLDAPTELGALHGLETMLQLVRPTGASGFEIPAVSISDSPRFRWRGLMVDCSRHFEPIDALERTLDAMAAVKLNVFHWHLADDQGFRMQSKRFPKLTELGSDGDFYTEAQARELVAYAHARGIRVVPEFEMPGHSAAWLVAYPELNSGTKPDGIRREFGISDTALDPTRDETYTFIAALLGEMTAIFPDQYVHIGGDETPAPDWKINPRLLAFKKAHNLADNEALQAYFNRRVLAILMSLNCRMVGWDEILDPGLPKDVVIQSWRGEASLTKGAQQGYQGVLSAPYYLDAMKPAGTMYLADPLPADTQLLPAQQRLILGGEVCMWAEHLNDRTLDSRLWPRTAALAERFWSPANVRDVDDMYRRLRPVSLELEALGTRHLTGEGAALRDLAGSEDIAALQVFAAAFEPVSFSDRYDEQHTDHFTPLTGFVDAVRPDQPICHSLEVAAAQVLGKAAVADQTTARSVLLNFFLSEANALPAVENQIAHSPRLAPLAGRARQLAQLAQTGLQALTYLDASAGKAPAGWKGRSLAAIARARKPDALVRFHFLDVLQTLVERTP